MKEHDVSEISFKNGYNKAAREIFEEIEKCMDHDYISPIGVYNGALKLRIAELKKKYTGEKNEIKTLYERIKAMPLEEMASFFTYLYQRDIIATADRFICRKCKKEHGYHCPIKDDDKCLYDLSDKETIKLWLEGAAYGEVSDEKG